MAGVLLTLVLGAAPALACEEPAERVESALQSLRTFDLDGAESAIQAAEEALGCSPPASPELIARLWLAEGFLAVIRRENEAAQAPFSAAASLAPAVWIDDFGPAVRQMYEEAIVDRDAGVATVEASPQLGQDWEVWLDGERISLPSDVPAGLHLVQIVEPEGAAHHAVVMQLEAGMTGGIAHTLPPSPPEPPIRWEPNLHLAVGPALFLGGGIDTQVGGTALVEPGTKPLLTTEVGFDLARGPIWSRLAVQFAPILSGRFVYAGASQPKGSSLGIGVAAAGGWRRERLRLGLTSGIFVPSRVSVAALGDVNLIAGLNTELRAGLNVTTDGRAEPALTWLLSYRLGPDLD